MNIAPVPQVRPRMTPVRSAEGEGILRMLLLALALAMPLGVLAYLKVQQLQMGYQMTALKEQLDRETERTRALLLERSRLQRDESIQAFARQQGLKPRKQSHYVPKAFTREDQRLAKLAPVRSDL